MYPKKRGSNGTGICINRHHLCCHINYNILPDVISLFCCIQIDNMAYRKHSDRVDEVERKMSCSHRRSGCLPTLLNIYCLDRKTYKDFVRKLRTSRALLRGSKIGNTAARCLFKTLENNVWFFRRKEEFYLSLPSNV